MQAHPSIPAHLRPTGRVVIVRACVLVLGLSLGACEDGSEPQIGTPCEVDEDCGQDMICDAHQGEGTCQEPHEHLEARPGPQWVGSEEETGGFEWDDAAGE